jgi:hypothetical protein
MPKIRSKKGMPLWASLFVFITYKEAGGGNEQYSSYHTGCRKRQPHEIGFSQGTPQGRW